MKLDKFKQLVEGYLEMGNINLEMSRISKNEELEWSVEEWDYYTSQELKKLVKF